MKVSDVKTTHMMLKDGDGEAILNWFYYANFSMSKSPYMRQLHHSGDSGHITHNQMQLLAGLGLHSPTRIGPTTLRCTQVLVSLSLPLSLRTPIPFSDSIVVALLQPQRAMYIHTIAATPRHPHLLPPRPPQLHHLQAAGVLGSKVGVAAM